MTRGCSAEMKDLRSEVGELMTRAGDESILQIDGPVLHQGHEYRLFVTCTELNLSSSLRPVKKQQRMDAYTRQRQSCDQG